MFIDQHLITTVLTHKLFSGLDIRLCIVFFQSSPSANSLLICIERHFDLNVCACVSGAATVFKRRPFLFIFTTVMDARVGLFYSIFVRSANIVISTKENTLVLKAIGIKIPFSFISLNSHAFFLSVNTLALFVLLFVIESLIPKSKLCPHSCALFLIAGRLEFRLFFSFDSVCIGRQVMRAHFSSGSER